MKDNSFTIQEPLLCRAFKQRIQNNLIKNTNTMKTLVKITIDNIGVNSYDNWLDNVTDLAKTLNVQCKITNDRFNNPIALNDCDNPQFDKVAVVRAVGYCQSDWQTYTLHVSSASLTFADDAQMTLRCLKTFVSN
jgi:hypothetical protein